MKSTIGLLLLLVSQFVYAEETLQQACKDYHQAMSSIPHVTTGIDVSAIITTHEGKQYKGCSAEVSTKWSLVGEGFNQSTVLELPGWKTGSFIADGPGTSIYDMLKDNMFCLVGYHFSAYVDEKKDKLITGDELKMFAQCARY